MRAAVVFISLVALASVAVGATYPVCTGEALCAYDGSGRDYCCPEPSMFADIGHTAATSSCTTQPDCAMPAYVAKFNQPGCPESGTLERVAVPVSYGSAQSGCISDAVLGSTSRWRLDCGAVEEDSWTFTQFVSEADCNNNLASPLRARTTSIAYLDTACYNVAGGSIMVVCPLSGVEVRSTAVINPPMHDVDLAGSSPSTLFGQLSLGFWQGTGCLAGSATMKSASTNTCERFTYGSILASFKVTCASATEHSSWTASMWPASTCSGTAASTFSGSGRSCVNVLNTLFPSGASLVVDCTRQLQGKKLNYLEPQDGYYSQWSECSNQCGQGTQTRSCIAPRYGGLPCPNPDTTALSQSCSSMDGCGGGAETSSGGGAETSSGGGAAVVSSSTGGTPSSSTGSITAPSSSSSTAAGLPDGISSSQGAASPFQSHYSTITAIVLTAATAYLPLL